MYCQISIDVHFNVLQHLQYVHNELIECEVLIDERNFYE